MDLKRIDYEDRFVLFKKFDFQTLMMLAKTSKGSEALIFSGRFMPILKKKFRKFLEEEPDKESWVLDEVPKLLIEHPWGIREVGEGVGDVERRLNFFFKVSVCKGHVVYFPKLPYGSLELIMKKMNFPNMVKLMKSTKSAKDILEGPLNMAFIKANNDFVLTQNAKVIEMINEMEEERCMLYNASPSVTPAESLTHFSRVCSLMFMPGFLKKKSEMLLSKIITPRNEPNAPS